MGDKVSPTVGVVSLPWADARPVSVGGQSALGISHRWRGGQYCALLTEAGLVGCGIYDIECANEFNFAFALAKGTPARPLVEPEDLLPARIVRVSRAASELGIEVGMTGEAAVEKLLAASKGTSAST